MFIVIIMKEVITFLNNLINKDDIIIVGTSGGPDSMCLLHLLTSNFSNKIICAHVNHNVRKEAIKEAEFLKKYCQENHLIFEYMEITKYKNNKFSESEGRSKRYQFFNELKEKYRAKYIMTAHHANDLEETILMRLIRGSNLKGYMGIPRINNHLVRPLLTITKKEILAYNEINNINYFTDYTNNDINYTRNRYRETIIPLLEKEDVNIHKKFIKFSKELSKYNDYINRVIKSKIHNIYKNGIINISNLKKEDSFLQEKIIEYVIEDIQKEEILDINDKNKIDLLNLINDNKNKQIDLGNGFIGRRSYNNLIIEKNNIVVPYDYILTDSITINEHFIIEKISNSKDKSNNVIRINSDDIELPLHVRSMHKDDVMHVKNMLTMKKVNDIFKNSKIDIKKRKVYPLVVDSKNVIIWIPGIKKSKFDKEIYEKYDIILKCTEEKYE